MVEKDRGAEQLMGLPLYDLVDIYCDLPIDQFPAWTDDELSYEGQELYQEIEQDVKAETESVVYGEMTAEALQKSIIEDFNFLLKHEYGNEELINDLSISLQTEAWAAEALFWHGLIFKNYDEKATNYFREEFKFALEKAARLTMIKEIMAGTRSSMEEVVVIEQLRMCGYEDMAWQIMELGLPDDYMPGRSRPELN